MQDFDLRELRYFLAAAEELNFSRAAERLGMSQPPLSRTIRRMERRLGAPLFHRSHNAVRLTPAGETLRSEACKVLEVASAASLRTRRAAQALPALTVTAAPGQAIEMLRRITGAYAALPGAPRADIAVTGYSAQAAALRSGRADLALLSTPFDANGLETRVLCAEERVAAVPLGHRLARRAELRCSDLAGEPVPRWPGDTEACRRYWSAQDRAIADPAQTAEGPLVHDISQLIEVVGLGQALALVPGHIADRNPRPDVVYLPVADVSPYATVIAWARGADDPAVALFAETATGLFRGSAPTGGRTAPA